MNNHKIDITCTKCGNCCRGFSEEEGVILFPKDFETIPAALGISSKEFKARYCYSQQITTERKQLTLYFLYYTKGNCIFLEKNGLCRIFDFRPIQCQCAPFHFFWNGKLDYEYDCTKNIKVRKGWTSSAGDYELLNSLFNK